MKTLLALATGLEMGWNVCCLIPALRNHSRNFDKTIIVCRPKEEYLMEDFADGFVQYEPKGHSDRWLLNGRCAKMPEKIAHAYPGAEIRRPGRRKCMKWKREYFKYGQEPTDERYQIVFHARHMNKYGQGHWNYPPEWYSKALKILDIDPKRCASIGLPNGSYHVSRTIDLRGIDMKRLCRILAHSRLCVGSSSGPMHLASLCGCRHVVITGNEWQKAINATNKKQYKQLWNPFKTECIVLDKDKWRPRPEKVAKAVAKMLEGKNTFGSSFSAGDSQ